MAMINKGIREILFLAGVIALSVLFGLMANAAWPPWMMYFIAAACGAVGGAFHYEYQVLGAISGLVIAMGMVTAFVFVLPGAVGNSRPFVVLASVAPGYCLYYIGKEIMEPKVSTDSPIALQDPDWMGTPEGRRRRLKVIGLVFLGLIALGAILIAVNQ